VYINGIEGVKRFWSYSRERLLKFHGGGTGDKYSCYKISKRMEV
jgi:hypothetical protein